MNDDILQAIDACPIHKMQHIYCLFAEMTSLDLMSSAWNAELDLALEKQVDRIAHWERQELHVQFLNRLLELHPETFYGGMDGETINKKLLALCHVDSWEQLLEASEAKWLKRLEQQWASLNKISLIEHLQIDDSFQQFMRAYEATKEKLGFKAVITFTEMIERNNEQFELPLDFYGVLKHENSIQIVAGDFLSYRLANTLMKRDMIPAVLAQLLWQGIQNPTARLSKLEQHVQRVMTHYEKICVAIDQLFSQHKEAELDLQMMTELQGILRKKYVAEKRKIDELYEQLFRIIRHMTPLPVIEPYTSKIEKALEEIERYENLQQTSIVQANFFDKLKETSKKLEYRSKVRKLQYQLESLYEAFVQAILEQRYPIEGTTQIFYDLAIEEIRAIEQEQREVQQRMQQKNAQIATYIQQIEQLEKRQITFETRYRMARRSYIRK